jgi:hypothetical protein
LRASFLQAWILRRDVIVTVYYLQPAASPALPPEPYLLLLSNTDAPVLGLVANGFAGSERFLDHLSGALRDLIPAVKIRRYRKADPTSKTPDPMLREILSECDGVIGAYGHCGSCTSGTMRDAIMFARSGLPSIALVTSKFIEEAEFIARASGMPDAPRVTLPHPVAGSGDVVMARLAREITPTIVHHLGAER